MRYEPSTFADLESFAAYLESLSAPMESFFEDHILESQFHRILIDDREVGFFAVLRGTLLTQFHLVGQARRFGQQVFSDLLADYAVTEAFVPTFDPFLLCQALDASTRIKMQAHFFTDEGRTKTPAIHTELKYKLATASDLVAIEDTSGDFLDKPAEDVANNKIHLGFLKGELVSIGIIVRGRILKGHASIGMFTKETHRQKGIGTSAILHLKEVCRQESLEPLAGCGYQNHNSKRTLEAAGMLASSRLVGFELKEPA